MDRLTPDAVATHAAEHPLHIRLAPNHIEGFVVEGLPLGQWRYMGDDPHAFPMFFAVALDGSQIRAMCMEGRYEMDLTNCPPGTWTPVRQDGSDLHGTEEERQRWATESAEAIAEAYETGRMDGRAEERAAIVAGLEWIAQTWRGCSETALADGDPGGTAQTYRERGKAVEMACDRLAAGEWSAKS